MITTPRPNSVAMDPKLYQVTRDEEAEFKALLDREDHRFNGELWTRIHARLAVKMTEVDDGKLLNLAFHYLYALMFAAFRRRAAAPANSWDEFCPPGTL